MRGQAHSDELKAEVMGALIAGMSISDAARKFKLDKSIVSRIRSNINGQKLQQVATENEIRIDVIIAESLMEHLTLQRAIVRVASANEYIKTQDANGLAKLLEVSQNYTIRLLEAASIANEGEEDPAY